MQGCLPSHLIFLRRHSSQARVTLRRFWMGCDGAVSPSTVILSSSGSDLTLSAGDGASWMDQSPAGCDSMVAASSSDMLAASYMGVCGV